MEIQELKTIAKNIRIEIIEMLDESGSGHSGGSLGIVEVLVALYFEVAKVYPKNPNAPDRDRIILSAGHLCPALYAVLAEKGFFPKTTLSTLRKLNSPLQGHPHRNSIAGVENSSGPLGQGISVAVGEAIAAKIDKKNYRIWCVCSDGECDEGEFWEALMSANKYDLGNLCIVIDRNHIQIDGRTEQIMPLEPLVKKLQSFGLNVEEVSGHNFYEIIDGLLSSKNSDRPTAVIAHTTPGKGVSFMEGRYQWHGKAPDHQEAKQAIEELKRIVNG